jgi:hypothetical protein
VALSCRGAFAPGPRAQPQPLPPPLLRRPPPVPHPRSFSIPTLALTAYLGSQLYSGGGKGPGLWADRGAVAKGALEGAKACLSKPANLFSERRRGLGRGAATCEVRPANCPLFDPRLL